MLCIDCCAGAWEIFAGSAELDKEAGENSTPQCFLFILKVNFSVFPGAGVMESDRAGGEELAGWRVCGMKQKSMVVLQE